MAYTTSNYTGSNNYSSGPYLSTYAYFSASRASGADAKVTISCSFTLAFGTSADSSSTQGKGYGYDIAFTEGISTGYTTVDSTSTSWKCDGSSVSLGGGYSGKGPKKNAVSISGSISSWTSGAKYFTVTIYETSSSGRTAKGSFRVSLGCPTYYTNASVSMTTKSQTVNPGGTVTFQWSGSNGTNNKISKYTLYYNGTAYDCGTSTSKTLAVPPATKAYSAYVKATATYNSPTSGTITITTNDYGTPTATLSTTTQTLKPDQKLKIQWSGTAGTSNPISSYQLYYNDDKVYDGTDTSFTVDVPPVGSSYSVYVKALGQYGSKVGTSSTITITTAPYLWVGVGGAWKSVQSVYIIVNGVWKDVDPDKPLNLEVGSSWKGV